MQRRIGDLPRRAGGKAHAVQRHVQRVPRVIAACDQLPAVALHIRQHDVAIDGDRSALRLGIVARVEIDRPRHAAQADVLIADALHQPAAAWVALDPQARCRAVEGQPAHQHVGHAAHRLAADRHAVPGVDVAVEDRDVAHAAAVAGLDRDIVVAGAEAAVRDRHVLARARIDPVGVARIGGRIDRHAPGGEAPHVIDRDVEIRRIGEARGVQHQIASAIHRHQPRHVLLAAFALRPACELPPCLGAARHRRAARTVDRARPHDRRIGGIGEVNQRATAMALGIDRPAQSLSGVEPPWVGDRAQRRTGFEPQGHARRHLDRPALVQTGAEPHRGSATPPQRRLDLAAPIAGGGGQRDAGGGGQLWLHQGSPILCRGRCRRHAQHKHDRSIPTHRLRPLRHRHPRTASARQAGWRGRPARIANSPRRSTGPVCSRSRGTRQRGGSRPSRAA